MNRDKPKNEDIYQIIMGSDRLSPDWNLYYGLTENRLNSLLKDKNHKNSFFNMKSENSLSLFIFGNLDDWRQDNRLKIKPRDERSRWNQKFFDSLRKQQGLYKNRFEKNGFFKKIIERKLDLEQIDMKNSILLFEFGIMNSAFHNGETFRKLSFLDLQNTNRWVKFDAVLIIPSEKLFIFFESKLDSDISRSTSRYPKVNQIIKGLESAYLLTNHEESLYNGWDFRYVLTCPRIINEYNLTYYKSIIKYIGKNLAKYNDIINTDYYDCTNDSCYPQYFGQFVKEVREKISMIYWDELADLLSEHDENFFGSYLKRIENKIKDRRKVKAIRNRFKKVNIRF